MAQSNIDNQSAAAVGSSAPAGPSQKGVTILGIESSCDDTSAAVIRDGILLSNVTASQQVHQEYGGVVPELASRAHQQNIVPVVDTALRRAQTNLAHVDAIAFTLGPGLIGSLLVGASFAKGLALGAGLPLISVDHLQGHTMSVFLRESAEDQIPEFPFLCLLVSGGNSQIILARGYGDMQTLGRTIDDAAGEAFDKCAKVMGLPYPGGPFIDRLASQGDPGRFNFAHPHVPGYNYSFSGLKTSFLYTLRDALKTDPEFIEKNKADLAASLQRTIIEILLEKLAKVVDKFPVGQIALAGGVAANTGVRQAVEEFCRKRGIKPFIPKRSYTTDNAAMIAIAGYFKFLAKDFCDLDSVPYAKIVI